MVYRTACAIFNNLERTKTQISKSCHYLTLNISETVRDTDSYKDVLIGTYGLLKCVISNDLACHCVTYTEILMTRSIARYLCDTWAFSYLLIWRLVLWVTSPKGMEYNSQLGHAGLWPVSLDNLQFYTVYLIIHGFDGLFTIVTCKLQHNICTHCHWITDQLPQDFC